MNSFRIAMEAIGYTVFLLSIGGATAWTVEALAQTPPEDRYEARLILDIRDEKLRVFQYETPMLICHISIIDVQMIGAQASVSCVRKNERDEKPRRSLPR